MGKVRLPFRKKRRIDELPMPKPPKRRLRTRIRNLSLRKTYVLYMLLGMCVSLLLCAAIAGVADSWRQEHIYLRYAAMAIRYEVPEGGSVEAVSENMRYMTFMIRDAGGEIVNEFQIDGSEQECYVSGFYDDDVDAWPVYFDEASEEWLPPIRELTVETRYSADDSFLDMAIGIVASLSIPGCFIAGAIICSMLFYRNKLRQPLQILEEAAARIARSDLDFRVMYDREDEMGRLCDAFESMRDSLEQNNRRLWRSVEERKRLNAAFAHDLRTPLTVLKGYADMMMKFAPDEKCPRGKLTATARTMARHVLRIEGYVNSMSDIQRLEDLPCNPELLNAPEFIDQTCDAMRMLCDEKDKLLDFRAEPMLHLRLDRALVARVWENLLRNALRFSSNCVRVECRREGPLFLMSVSNDGRPFTQEELRRAADAYYSSDNRDGEAHFGLGLHICKIICEKHGGGLQLENHPMYGATVIASFRADSE